MNCSKVQSLLSSYLDRELTGAEMLALREHLGGCQDCREEEAELRCVKHFLGSVEIPAPVAGFEERLVRNVMLQSGARQRRVHSPLFAFTGLATAAMGLTFLALAVTSHISSSQQTLLSHRSGLVGLVSQKKDLPASSTIVRLEQDHAYLAGGDPLSGPAMAVAASYARP